MKRATINGTTVTTYSESDYKRLMNILVYLTFQNLLKGFTVATSYRANYWKTITVKNVIHISAKAHTENQLMELLKTQLL